MADDHPQRPIRGTDAQGRGTPTANNPAAGSDPLAELARLIGQSDPFGEFGRDSAPAQPAAPPPQAPNQPEPMLRELAAQAMPRGAQAAAGEHGAEAFPAGYGEDYARQPYGSPPLAGDEDVYHVQGGPVPGYDDHAGYQEAGFEPGPPPYAGDEHGYQDYYDDIPPPRRRMGVLAIAAVFALAVLGTAGAFGYRALFGSVSSGPPPVIKADSKPAKIVPEKDKSQSAKLINDRINAAGGAQKLVSREEQPVDLSKEKPPGVATQDQSLATAGSMQAPALGSGVIGSDPRKIHTITIRPDQPVPGATAMPADQASVADEAPPAAIKPAQPLAPAQPVTHEARQPRRTGATPHRHPSCRTAADAPGRQRAAEQCAAVLESERACARRAAGGTCSDEPSGGVAAAGHLRWRRLCGTGVLAPQPGRCAGRAEPRAEPVPQRRRRPAGHDPARRSRQQQGRLLPRHDRPVRQLGGGKPLVQPAEGRGRLLLRPENLESVRSRRLPGEVGTGSPSGNAKN